MDVSLIKLTYLIDIITTLFAAVFLEILLHLKSSLKNSGTLKIESVYGCLLFLICCRLDIICWCISWIMFCFANAYEQNCSLCFYGIKTIKSGPQGSVPPDKLVYEVKRSPCQTCLSVLLLVAFALWLFSDDNLWLEQLFNLWDGSAVFLWRDWNVGKAIERPAASYQDLCATSR